MRAGLIFGDDTLFLQIVLEDGLLRAGKEVGFEGVEGDSLDDALSLGEGALGSRPGEGVDEHLRGHLDVVGHSGEVIAFGMPHHLANHIL